MRMKVAIADFLAQRLDNPMNRTSGESSITFTGPIKIDEDRAWFTSSNVQPFLERSNGLLRQDDLLSLGLPLTQYPYRLLSNDSLPGT